VTLYNSRIFSMRLILSVRPLPRAGSKIKSNDHVRYVCSCNFLGAPLSAIFSSKPENDVKNTQTVHPDLVLLVAYWCQWNTSDTGRMSCLHVGVSGMTHSCSLYTGLFSNHFGPLIVVSWSCVSSQSNFGTFLPFDVLLITSQPGGRSQSI
jgi:hypothetical protein